MADQAIVERSCAKLRSAIGDEATDFNGDLQEMLKTLEDIKAAMPDTEKLSAGCQTQKEWVKKASTAAYGVFELVDKFMLQSARSPAAGKMKKMVDLPQNNMSEKMKKMKETLKELARESIGFDVKSRASNPTAVPPGAIVGRDEEREKIIAQLFEGCHSEEPIIFLLAGEEGIGKTTVAKMVFNDARFRCYSRVWVNDSEDLNEIGKSIISQLSGKEETSHALEDDMESITERLHELLNGIKVLVVLDDLFMLSYEWKPLKGMFSVRDKGSQVIVVATTSDPPPTDSVPHVHVHSLPVLTEDMCCTIIKQRSGRFEKIPEDPAEYCGGLPLAAQLFGGLLKFKRNEEWQTQLDQIPRPRPNSVALSLTLSYESMPGPLKLCLDYCTISCVVRPRGLVKEDLIHQWIALGLIEPSDSTIISATNLAEDYITRLLDMAFLQTANLPPAGGNDETGAIFFNMHDRILQYGWNLIKENSSLAIVADPEDSSVSEHCRHVFLLGKAWPSKLLSPDQNMIISSIHCLDCSDMKLSEDSFSVPSCLRVLNLEKTAIERLPDSICRLEQLGYLNLSGCSGLVRLPENFGELKRLLHINLSDCSALECLPEKFGELKKLLHINLSGCSGLVYLPESFGELEILQYINLSGCSGLDTLPESFGKLIDLVHVDLSGCCALKNLQEFFGKLASLKHLNLSGYSGLVTLPRSFGKLIKLVHINLSNCSGLSKLPQSFGKLTSLEYINLSGCSGLVTLPKSFGDLRNLLHIDLSRCSGLSKLPGSFGKLQKLKYIGLSGCSGLVTLPETFGDLTNLLHIDLSRCCGLSKLPESFKKLRKLVYLDLSFWSCFEGINIALRGLTSLQHLNLSNPCCYRADQSYLEELKEVFGNLSELQYLNLSMLLNPLSYGRSKKKEENLEYIGCISGLYRLEHLDLSHNIFLYDLPKSLSHLCSLHTLDLSGCIRLKTLGTWMTGMHSLKSIILRDCEGLESYRFEVGIENNINNYVQLQEVTSKTLEITCLEKMKRLNEAERIKLEEKLRLQTLKLCWTHVKSVEENERDRATVDNGSPQENKLDRSVEEIEHGEEIDPKVSVEKNSSVKAIEEHEDYVERNELDMSVEETGPKVSVEKNRSIEKIEEHEVYVKRNEHDQVSVEENKPARSAEEIELADVSWEKKNKTDRSAEEIEQAEISGEKNKTDRSIEEIEPAEVSGEKNKTDRSVEEIEPAEVSGEENRTDRCTKEIEPTEGEKNSDRSAEEIEQAEFSGYKDNIHMPAQEIEPAEVSGENNKTERSAGKIESDAPPEKNRTADGCVEENDLLGALKPPPNVKYLELHGYRGKSCCPSWLFDNTYSADLHNLVEVTMQDFPSCQTLPPFGLLPKLQRLVVRRMASVRRIDAGDLIGSNRPAEAECTIELDDMPVLEEFNTTYNSGAKRQLVLRLHKCPSLSFGTFPPRFRRLKISKCAQRVASVGKKQQEYEMEGPSELVDKICSMPIYQWSLLDHRSVLRSLTIHNCSLDEYHELLHGSLHMCHFTSVEELKIESCQLLHHLFSWEFIPKPTSLKSLHLTDCKDFRILKKVFEDLTNLEELCIKHCPEIKDLPESISKLTDLKNLYVIDCPSLKQWCEKKDNKKRLGHLRVKYELPVSAPDISGPDSRWRSMRVRKPPSRFYGPEWTT